MTTTLQVRQTKARLERAVKYLELLERCKSQYRLFRKEEVYWVAHRPEDIWNSQYRYARFAERRKLLYRYLTDRFNNTVCDSFIIAPHELE